jgi:PAN domain
MANGPGDGGPNKETKSFSDFLDSLSSSFSREGKATWSDHVKNVALAIAAVSAAIFIPLVGFSFTNAQKDREIASTRAQKDLEIASADNRTKIEQAQKVKELGKGFIELGTKILSDQPTPKNEPLRGWAIDVINHYVDPDVKIPMDVQNDLLRKVPLPSTQAVVEAFQLPAAFTYQENVDMYGRDIVSGDDRLPGFKALSLKACAAACDSASQCVAFSFDHTAQWCYLKNAVGPAILDPRSTIGVRQPNPLPERSNKAVEMKDIGGTSITDQGDAISTSGPEECRTNCVSRSECLAYTFFKESARSANCKTFTTMHGVILNRSAVSGFKWQSPE